MAHNLNLQVLGGDYVKTALIAEWKVKVGDAVKKGDILLVTETAKITVDIESPCDGVIERILYPAGEDVDISETIAVIGDGSGVENAAPPAEAKPAEAALPAGSDEAGPARAAAPGRVFVTPVAKKIAREHGIDLGELKRTLGLPRIAKKQVLEWIASPPAAPAAPQPEPSSGVTAIPVKGRRRAIAQKMFASTSSKPRVTHFMDADMEDLFRVKDYLKKKYPDRAVSVTGLVAVAVKKALLDFPYMNATYENDTIYQYPYINLGIAVDMAEGLVVPVLKGCERLSGVALCEELTRVANGCKKGELKPGDYVGGTFTITNLGTEGVGHFTPIMNEPEIGILAMGAMEKKLRLENGAVAEYRSLPLSLSFDHRAVDGAPAGRFLRAVKENIEHMFLVGF